MFAACCHASFLQAVVPHLTDAEIIERAFHFVQGPLKMFLTTADGTLRSYESDLLTQKRGRRVKRAVCMI